VQRIGVGVAEYGDGAVAQLFAVRWTRQAISPRLAIRIFLRAGIGYSLGFLR